MSFNIGVIGVGYMAMKHCEGYSTVPGAKVSWLCSESGRGLDGKFEHVEGNIGEGGFTLNMEGVQTTKKWLEVLDDPSCEAVDICVPGKLHRAIATLAIQKGKHVLCEKPLATTSADAIAMARVAEKAPVVAMAAHCMLFWPGWAEPMAWIKAGAIPNIISAKFSRVGSPPGWGKHFLSGARGAVTDLGIHDWDFVREAFGQPLSISAAGQTVCSTDGSIDDMTAILRYPGHHVTIESSWARNPDLGFDARFEIRAKGGITITGGFAEGLKVYGMDPPAITSPYLFGQDTGWKNQLHYFVKCATEGAVPEVAAFAQASDSVQLLERGLAAANASNGSDTDADAE